MMQRTKNQHSRRMQKRILSPIILLLPFLLLWTEFSMAQHGGFAGAYNRMGFGARGMGMGNALTAVTQQGIYAHYNPALAAFVTDTQFDLSTAAMSFDRSLNSINAAFQLPPQAGINIGLQHGGVSNFDGRSVSGNPTETFSINEMNLFIAFGLRTSDRFSLGFTAKLLYADYFRDVSSQTGFGIDIGAFFKATESLHFGFSIRDLLSAYNWETSELYGTQGRTTENKFPVRITFGAVYHFLETGLLISADAEIQQQRSQSPVIIQTVGQTGGPSIRIERQDTRTSQNMLRIGSAYEIHERITLRGGWQFNDLDNITETHLPSLGFSLHLPYTRFSPSIDYTFLREPEGISYMHVFGLRFTL